MFKMKPCEKQKRILIAGFLTLLIILLCTPLLFDGVISGDDYHFHLSRIRNIADGLKEGHFPVKIHPSSMNSYGYGNGLFYPNFFLYLPAVLVLLGVELLLSYKIFAVVLTAALTLSTYFSSRYIYKSRYSAVMTTLLFTTAQTVITNMYYRMAVGETLAMVFIPMVIAGLYNVVHEDFSKPLILICAFLGLVYSHTITLFLSVVVAGFYLLINIRKLFFSTGLSSGYGWYIIGKLSLCAACVLLLSAGYWMPMLEQFLIGQFGLSTPWTYLSENSLSLMRLLRPSRPGLGLALIISAAAVLIYVISKRKSELHSTFRHPVRHMSTGFVLALLSTDLFFWSAFDMTFFNFIQFPWRLLPYSAAFLAFGTGGCLCHIFKENKKRLFSFLLSVLLVCLVMMGPLFGLRAETEPLPEDICNARWSVGFGEWLPLDTDTDALIHPSTVFTDTDEEIAVSSRQGNSLIFTVTEEYADTEYFDVPLLFYKGYSATITDENGHTENLSVTHSGNNLVRLISSGKEGRISVTYSGTMIQRLSYGLNSISAVLAAAYIITRIFSRKKTQVRKTKSH